MRQLTSYMKTTPIPVKGQGIAVPHAERNWFLIIFVPIMFFVCLFVAWSVVEFDKHQQAKEREAIKARYMQASPTPQRLINNTITP